MLVNAPLWFVKVTFVILNQFQIKISFICISDTCNVNNGECGSDATCSHDPKTNAVQCTCNIGFTNTSLTPNVVCTGKTNIITSSLHFLFNCRRLQSTEWWMPS